MKKATVYNEAALPDGSERFYRGAKGGEATPSKGLVFSRDRADAATYAAKIGGELSYVDVPKARVAELRPAANKPEARVIISREMAQGCRVAEPAQIAEPAPRQAAPMVRAIVGPAEYREAPRIADAERFYHGGKPDEQPSGKGMVFSEGFRRRRALCVQDRRTAFLHRRGEGAHGGSSAVVEGAGDKSCGEPCSGARAAGGAGCPKGRARVRVDATRANRGDGRTTIGERKAAEFRQGPERRDRGVKGGEGVDVEGWRSEAPNDQSGSGRRGDGSG